MRILRRDNVGEGFDSIRGLVRERVLFNMPIKLLQRINDIIPDLSVIRSVRYRGAKTVTLQPRSRRAEREKKNALTRSGYQDLRKMRVRVVRIKVL
jgi:hypothetical protein